MRIYRTNLADKCMTKQPSNRYKKDSKHVTTASQNQNAFEYLDEPRLKHAVRPNMRVHGHTAAANSYRCRKQLGPITPHTNDRHRASKEAHRGYNLSNRTSIGNRLKYADRCQFKTIRRWWQSIPDCVLTSVFLSCFTAYKSPT